MPMLSSGLVATGPLDPGSARRTAPVLEFVCLFTYDLRRKQKRWEDGRLNYHTFNKRVMVYDERGNFVGDMHWTREYDFDEGEEVQLERGGVIVQVAECVGRQEQDLTELLDKRAKEKEQRQARVAVRPSLPAATPITPLAGARAQEHFQTRHRPLNQLLGTPTGHHGRAVVPVESPFELRQRANDNPSDPPDSHSSKRRKLDVTPPSKKTYAQNLFGATLTLSAVPTSSAPRRPFSSSYRAQPEPSLPDQEDIPDNPSADLRREGRVSNGGLNAPLPRPLHGRSRPAVTEDQAQPDSEARIPGYPPPVKMVSNSRTVIQRAAVRGDPPPTSADRSEPPNVTGRVTTTEDSHRPLVTLRAGSSGSGWEFVAPKPGASFSQAIDLDEERQPPEPQEKAVAAPASKDNRRTTKQRPAKRKHSPQPAALEAESMNSAAGTRNSEEPPVEERTELRLKPRQKRGLLLLSERKSKSNQREARDAPGRERRRNSRSSNAPADTVAAETSVDSDPAAIPAQDDPFSSSPAVPEDAGSLLLRSDERQAARRLKGSVDDSTDSIRRKGTATPSDDQSPPQELPESPRSACSPKDGVPDRSPSPRRRRLRSRSKSSTTYHEEPDTTSNPGSEEPEDDIVSQPRKSRSSRQVRTTKTFDDEDQGHANKRVRRESLDDKASNEVAQAPVRPHLARLSRKSVRSRELIGFVPSGPAPFMNSGLLPLGARSFAFTEDSDTAGAASLAEPANPEPPAPDENRSPTEAQPSLGKPQPALPSAAAPQAAPPVLQRHNSLPNGRMGKQMAKDTSDGKGQASATPQIDEPPKPRSFVRHASAVLPSRMNMDQTATEAPSAPVSESIAAPEGKAAPKVTVLDRANPQPPVPADSTTLRPQLQNNPPKRLEQPADPKNGSSDTAADVCVTDGANKTLSDAPAPCPSRPKIANPATRGRKAALKSHAAGQVPQSILPPVEPPPAPGGIRPPPPPAMPRPEPAASERPKRTMRFPGFSSAKGGGPWSREAHDLLESARPC